MTDDWLQGYLERNPDQGFRYLDPKDFKQPLMLDIGAGGKSSDEKFTSVDLVTEADIRATMWDIPLPDGSVDAIWSSNALEHVALKDVVPTLREWHRLLRPNGKLQLIVPDMEWAAAWWLNNQDDMGWSMAIIYGHQSHDGEFHKTAFTPNIITRHLEATNLPWKVHKMEYVGGEILSLEQGENLYESNVNQRLINVELEKI